MAKADGLCGKCGQPRDGFNSYWCNACQAEYLRARRAKDPEKAREYEREYRAKNREKVNTYSREYRKAYLAKYPEKRAVYDRKSTYGLTKAEFDRLYEKQDGRCAGCGVEMLLGGPQANSLSVDHDHRTGRVRGLLCASCNKVVGYCHEDVRVLQGVIAYLLSALPDYPNQAEEAPLNRARSGFDSPVGHYSYSCRW